MDARPVKEKFNLRISERKKRILSVVRVQHEQNVKSLRAVEVYKLDLFTATYFGNLPLKLNPEWLPTQTFFWPSRVQCVTRDNPKERQCKPI